MHRPGLEPLAKEQHNRDGGDIEMRKGSSFQQGG